MNTRTLTKLMNRYGYELDGEGQVVIYTGYYQLEDGTLQEGEL